MIADTILAGAAVALAVLYLLSLYSGIQAERDLDRVRAQLDACRTLLEQVDREHAACEDAGERLGEAFVWPQVIRAGGPRPVVRNVERSE